MFYLSVLKINCGKINVTKTYHCRQIILYHSAIWRRQWHPTPVLLPGKSHGRRSLVGRSPWGPEESDTTEQLHFHFHALEKEMATHSTVFAWRIPGTGEPGGLPSMGSHRVGHDWSDLAAFSSIVLYIIEYIKLKPLLQSIHRTFCIFQNRNSMLINQTLHCLFPPDPAINMSLVLYMGRITVLIFDWLTLLDMFSTML